MLEFPSYNRAPLVESRRRSARKYREVGRGNILEWKIAVTANPLGVVGIHDSL